MWTEKDAGSRTHNFGRTNGPLVTWNLGFNTIRSLGRPALSLLLYHPLHESPPHLLSSGMFSRFLSFLSPALACLSTHNPRHPSFFLSVSAASSGARGLKAKFESMAEEKRKQEEEEKTQQMARQQQERKAVVKMSREAQQPSQPAEEPAVPAPLPKKISSEVSASSWGRGVQDLSPRQASQVPKW